MKFLPVLILILIFGCDSNKKLDVTSFRTGKFEIPANDKYQKTTFQRFDTLQIETYEDRIDSLSIHWKDNFNYTLKMLNPKKELDQEPIHVRITGIKSNSYTFEAQIGYSNYKQKGTVIKVED